MNECTTCNVCESPGVLADSKEIGEVFSHVRCFSDEKFTVWRCNNCRSLHSKEAVDLGRYYAEYPFKNHRLDFHTRVGYRNRVRLLKASGAKPEDAILDFGCGAGLYVEFLKTHGFPNAVGFDPFISSYSETAVLDRQYDVVVSHDVIEHVDEPVDFFDQMVRLVKPGGLVVVGTPNAAELKVVDVSGPAVELSQPYHRHILSEQALTAMAGKYGLTNVSIYRRFYFDTLVPSVNTRFMWTYIETTGGMIDVAVGKPDLGIIFGSPKLLFYALFGYFFRVPGNILITFRAAAQKSIPAPRPAVSKAA